MKTLTTLLSILALALVIVPPVAFLTGSITDDALMKKIMLAGTALWFVSAPLWLRATPVATQADQSQD